MKIVRRGNVRRVAVRFTDLAGAALDPGVVVFTVTTEDVNGAIATATYTYGTNAQVVRAVNTPSEPLPPDVNGVPLNANGTYYMDVECGTRGYTTVEIAATGTGESDTAITYHVI